MRTLPACLAAILSLLAFTAAGGEVKAYKQDVELAAGEEAVRQTRWYLENDRLRVGVIGDPGGAVVEFLNKTTGTDHAAGEVYSLPAEDGSRKKVGWGWKNTISDNAYDPLEKQMHYQPFEVSFEDGPDGAKTIKVTGRTAEQQLERRHTLRPDAAELIVHNRLTNIAKRPRRLWLRWHPYLFACADRYGDAGCVLSPGEGDRVRKIRIGWGWDHWFRTHDGYWLSADFQTGEGLFTTFEKEKVPVHFTWTTYKGRSPTKGALTMEPFPEPVMAAPGDSVEIGFSYAPFTADTAADDIPMGVLTDPEETERARRFLRRVKAPDRLTMLNRYTFARSIQFHWGHRRRDLLAVRDWGFADCAIVGFPSREMSMRVRMVGGVFDEAAEIEGFPASYCRLGFEITATDQNENELYRNTEWFQVFPGVEGQNFFDREIPVPMAGMPDGTYTLRVAAIDPMTRKPFHRHETQVEVFDNRARDAREELAKQLATGTGERPFVAALRDRRGALADGRAVIPIGVEDGSRTERKGFPVRLGVPLPQGALQPGVAARLLSPEGRTVPAQFAPMNVWPDGSLKWLGVDFAADCPADSFVFYRLEAGEGVAALPSAAPLATADGDAVELVTGPMRIRIRRDALTVPGEVWIDRNGNGTFEEDEQALLASEPGDAWWLGDDGTRFALDLRGEASGGFRPGVELERNGPESAVVKVTGWYLDGRSRRVALGEVRVEVFRGKAFFKLWHQVTFTGSPWHDRLAGHGLTLRAAPGAFEHAAFEVDNRETDVGAGGSLYQSSHTTLVVKDAQGRAVRTGRHSNGALVLRAADRSLLVYHRDFWQMHPKRLAVDAAKGTVAIDYWPTEAGVQDFAPYEEYWIPSSSSAEACGTGVSRTHELVVDLSGAVAPVDARAVYGEPVIACTPPGWVQQTDVLGNLYPCDPDRYPAVERYVSELTDFYDRNRAFFGWYGHWDYGTLHNVYEEPLYNWLVVGRYANIGNEEDIVQAPWLLYFRSGDRRHFEFARLWTRHLMEVQSIRWHDTWPEWAGMSRRHHYTTSIGGGDWGHTMLCPWLEYYHAAGYEPAWDMARRTAEAMKNTFEGKTWRYLSNPLAGNARMYLETGEQHYKDAADRMWRELCAPDRGDWWVASHGSRMAHWYAPRNAECMRLWQEWCRNGVGGDGKKREFQYLDSFGALGALTGDDWYAFKAMLRFDRQVRAGGHSGQLGGVNPVFRGMCMELTQYAVGHARRVVYAAGQIAKARERFPARFLNGRATEIVVLDRSDEPFSLFLDTKTAGKLELTGPDGQAVTVEPAFVFENDDGLSLLRVDVPGDGKKGRYRLKTDHVTYLGCSLETVAVLAPNELDFPGGDPLYARAADLGKGEARVLMNGTPGSSIEVFGPDGRRVFSRTLVRPAADAVAREQVFALSNDGLLKLGDKVGVVFPELSSLPLFLNRDGVFDLAERSQ